MTFYVGRVTVEYDYGLECRLCQVTDTGFSNPEDAADHVRKHNRDNAKKHAALLAKYRKATPKGELLRVPEYP